MAATHPLDGERLRRLRQPRRKPLRAGLAAALILLGAAGLPAQDTSGVPEARRAEAEGLIETPLAQRLQSSEVAEGLDFEERTARALLEAGDLRAAAEQTWRVEGRLRERGEFRRAEALLDEVLEALPAEQDLRPYLLLARAEVARHLGEIEIALDCIAEAEAGAEEGSRDERLLWATWGLRAQIHLDRGLVDLAAPLIEAEVAGLRGEARPDPGSLLAAALRLANLRIATSRYDLLVVELEEILGELDELDGVSDPNGRVRRTREQLELRLAMGLLYEARSDRHLDRGQKILTRISTSATTNETTRLAAATRLGQLGLARADLDFAEHWLGAARRSMESSPSTDELSIHDRAHLSALELRLSLLRSGGPAASRELLERLAGEVAELQRDWRSQPSSAGGLGLLRYDRTRTTLGELVAGIAALDEGERPIEAALEALMAARAESVLHRRLGTQAARLDEVRREVLSPGTGALVYLTFDNRGYVFTVDEDDVGMHELVSHKEVERLAKPWNAELMTSPADLSREGRDRRRDLLALRGREIADRLLPAEVRHRMEGWSSIYVVGQDLLEGIPLEALPFADGELLGQAKALGYLPSLSIGVHLARRARERSGPFEKDFCLVARVEAGPGAPSDLPFGAPELERIGKTFAQDRSTLLLGSRARLADLAGLERTALLHVVSHGTYEPSRERPHGIWLSAGDALWSDDAERLDAPALVVLSACKAGLGPGRWGDGPASSLIGALLVAGADAVVASTADLAYRPTLELTGAFQRELAAGEAPGEAMRRARRELAASDGMDDPFYHSLVRVAGLATRPVFASSVSRER